MHFFEDSCCVGHIGGECQRNKTCYKCDVMIEVVENNEPAEKGNKDGKNGKKGIGFRVSDILLETF